MRDCLTTCRPCDFEESEFTQVPLDVRLGKVFSIGIQPVSTFLQSWYNAADAGGLRDKVQLHVSFPGGLMPRSHIA